MQASIRWLSSDRLCKNGTAITGLVKACCWLHGGGLNCVDLDSGCLASAARSLDFLALDEALSRLAKTKPAKAELVKLRFFAGLTMPEAAAALNVSVATAERYWTFAKSWLYAELADDE
jgi:DNA-directed RNA polymerase specialized sigma24 family protein